MALCATSRDGSTGHRTSPHTHVCMVICSVTIVPQLIVRAQSLSISDESQTLAQRRFSLAVLEGVSELDHNSCSSAQTIQRDGHVCLCIR